MDKKLRKTYSAQSTGGGNCFTKHNCFDSFSDPIGSADRDYKSFRQWGQNHLKQKGTWYGIGAVVTAGCVIGSGGSLGLSTCAAAGGFVGGYGYSRANGESRQDSALRGAHWAGNAGTVAMAIQGAYMLGVSNKWWTAAGNETFFGTSVDVNAALTMEKPEFVRTVFTIILLYPKEVTVPLIYQGVYGNDWNGDLSDNIDVWYWN